MHLTIAHIVNYQMVGPDLNSVAIDCTPTLASAHDADPAKYQDNQWISSVFTEDGQTVYALVHNEYHGREHPGQCSIDPYQCNETTITLAVSTDGGDTFTNAAGPPDQLVASLPFTFDPGKTDWGLRSPSNIIGNPIDDYWYTYASGINDGYEWICAMRTDDFSDPAAWRYWDGTDYTGTFSNPYTTDATGHDCPAFDRSAIGWALNGSITFNSYLDRYVMVGLSGNDDGTWGIFSSFSRDQIHWSDRVLLKEMPLPYTVADGGNDLSYLYFTLIDPDSPSLVFDESGQTAYIYYTRLNHGAGSLDRDLLRVPVEFSFTD